MQIHLREYEKFEASNFKFEAWTYNVYNKIVDAYGDSEEETILKLLARLKEDIKRKERFNK